MSIDNYRKGFLSILDRKVIEQEIQLNTNIINDTMLPILPIVQEVIGSGVKSDHLKKLDGIYSRMVKSGGPKTFSSIEKKAAEALECLTLLKREVAKYIPNRLATDTMTFRQIAIIRMIEVVTHWVDFTQSFLYYALAAESAKESGTRFTDLISKGTIRIVEEGFINYANMTERLITPASKLEKDLRDTPDLIVRDTNEDIASQVHGVKSPNKEGFIYLNWNPVFRILSAWDDYQVSRYNRSLQQYNMFKLQLTNLTQLRDKSDGVNPAIESRIEELTAIIEALSFKLNKFRKKYGIEEEI